MRAELDLSRTAISAGYSVASLLAAGAIVVFGHAIDRFGGKRALFAFGLLFVASCLGMSLVGDLTSLTIGFAALRMLGPGALALSSSVLAVQWFVRQRGWAMDLTVLGLAASSAVVPVATLELTDLVGWRSAWAVLGLFILLAVVLPAATVVHDRPERMGLRPDGEPARATAFTNPLEQVERSWTAKEAMHTRTFWRLLFVTAVPALASTGLIFHQVAYLLEQGLEARTTAVFAAYGLANAASIFLTGVVLDRAAPRLVLIGLLGLLIAGITLLILAPAMHVAAVGYGLLIGGAVGGMGTASAVVWVIYYGRRYVGSIRGMEGTVKMVAAALGPLPLAVAHDQLGDYAHGLVAFAILAGLAAAAALGCRAPDIRQRHDLT